MARAPQKSKSTKVISAERQRFDLRLGELWDARELVGLFAWRDVVSLYKQTVLGPLWYLVQPLLTTVVFTIIFGRIANLSTDGLPQFLFYMAGTVVWSYFAACLTKTSNTFTANASMFGKVYFPRLTVPVSLLLSNMVAFGVQMVLFVGFVIYFSLAGSDVGPDAWIAITPLLIAIMGCLGLGSGILISALTTRYRDLQNLVAFGTQLLMYLTPIVYPLSSVSGKFRILLVANPMTWVVEAFRRGFLGVGDLSSAGLVYSASFAIVLLFVGLVMFQRVEKTFMDTV